MGIIRVAHGRAGLQAVLVAGLLDAAIVVGGRAGSVLPLRVKAVDIRGPAVGIIRVAHGRASAQAVLLLAAL